MIVVNEFIRLNIVEKGFDREGVMTINSLNKMNDKCTWACHDDTQYCKVNHVKFAKSYFDEIDPVYFGVIRYLGMIGNYSLANIIFLVILIPLMIYCLLLKSISIQIEINRLKKM